MTSTHHFIAIIQSNGSCSSISYLCKTITQTVLLLTQKIETPKHHEKERKGGSGGEVTSNTWLEDARGLGKDASAREAARAAFKEDGRVSTADRTFDKDATTWKRKTFI